MEKPITPNIVKALETLISYYREEIDFDSGVGLTVGDKETCFRVRLTKEVPPEGTLCPHCSQSGLDEGCNLCDGKGKLPDPDDDDETP